MINEQGVHHIPLLSLKTDSKNYEFIPLSTTQHKKNKEPKKLLIHPSKDYQVNA